MPVVCDNETIRGDTPIVIGDNNPIWEVHFNSGGRVSGKTAFLIFNVRRLAHAVESVPVKINDSEVGRIYPYALPNGQPNTHNQDHWFTQMIAFSSDVLNDDDGPQNTLEIQAVSFPDATGSNALDDFELKNIVCFFHQRA
jgi:hypothetical protein